MFVAAFIYHAEDPFTTQEKALMYLVSYIMLFLTGPGKFSVHIFFENKMSSGNKFIKFILG